MKRHPSRRACPGQRKTPRVQVVTAPREPLSVNAQHVADTLTDCLARTVDGECIGAVVVCMDRDGQLTTHLAGSYRKQAEVKA
ncbi:hypothetical protein [Niveibacterium microcysteis]|uniref:Uncharacterized protein n=1 Tax=Niveibacterium microcysteis TaxID=2811415 RepID=A0ABX7MAE3_9RHOO|nr:hypothetical protein [Niveibacterium microcysteis]QSI78683.1 hypothetical protein JY500_08785 [Niveibacterium microcysteis]